jgi:hypothetical protein
VVEDVVGNGVLVSSKGAGGGLSSSSGNPKEGKSVSLRGGAGADGEMDAFRGTGNGGLEEGGSTRVGAVDPVKSGLTWRPGDDVDPSRPVAGLASFL